jgi:site-specific DNA-methyltransferase (adenine-specific)
MGQDHYSEVPIGAGKFYVGDCFDVMRDLPDASVDMVLCDLPYGTTQNKWDSVLPLDRLWSEYWQVLKTDGAVVLSAQTPFDKWLGCSQMGALAGQCGHEFLRARPADSRVQAEA